MTRRAEKEVESMLPATARKTTHARSRNVLGAMRKYEASGGLSPRHPPRSPNAACSVHAGRYASGRSHAKERKPKAAPPPESVASCQASLQLPYTNARGGCLEISDWHSIASTRNAALHPEEPRIHGPTQKKIVLH